MIVDMYQAVDEALQECKAKLMKKLNIDQDEEMDILDISLSERKKYRIFAKI